MNRKISVFILLILLASSFKYRAKTAEADVMAAIPVKDKIFTSEKKLENDFEIVIDKMQQANRAFSEGNPQLFKSLWSHNNDVTIFYGSDNQELKGWELVESRISDVSRQMQDSGTDYTFEKIASKAGPDMGYLVQNEHYKMKTGHIDFRVTTLFRKENGEWKIVHRQADDLGTQHLANR